MKDLTPGQRWISHTEPELGLGKLVFADSRTVQIRFDASQCTRTYRLSAAPIKRILYDAGDTVRLNDGSGCVILSAKIKGGLCFYTSETTVFCETELCSSLVISRPQERLFSGLVDHPKLFNLRYTLLQAKAVYDTSPVKGLLGGQVSLLPHQFYIANTVAHRFIPRVLLADETGLGKTIEACLILHKLLAGHKISRVLIIVPQSLVHQWFVELYRKFNLSFMVFSDAYCRQISQSGAVDNPFLAHQLCIIGMNLLSDPLRQDQILSAGWDMLVIDEAHHITDSGMIFKNIKALARSIQGLMLLTATPEQMGQQNHFRHLQLIDPDRYFNYENFRKESESYEKTAIQIKDKKLSGDALAKHLDAYGPGRVVFKNRRSVVKGFPNRHCHLVTLPAGDELRRQANREIKSIDHQEDFSYSGDPRTDCLVDLIKKKEKILVIVQRREQAMAVEKAVAELIRTSLVRFDESMTLMQRDRHAAFFAQPDGAQVLVCSEIGSEGRNFQFVRHLFLFDLPINPELVEQRIGRLDRIGQQHDIHIWIPCIENSAQHLLALWYMDGLPVLKHHTDGTALIYDKYRQDLEQLIERTQADNRIDKSALDRFIQNTGKFYLATKTKLDSGHNILLELNSFSPGQAEQIIGQITDLDRAPELSKLFVLILDHFGIETDFFASKIFKLESDGIIDEGFPLPEHLPQAFTFDRATAVARDELDLVTWDHAFVHNTIEYFLTNLAGTCSTAVMTGQGTAGLLLETVYLPECAAPPGMNMELYLDPVPIRIIIDHNGEQVSDQDSFDSFCQKLEPDTPDWFKEMDRVTQKVIPDMLNAAQAIAVDNCKEKIAQGNSRIQKQRGDEIDRLIELKKVNTAIKDTEIDIAREQMAAHISCISHAAPRLDSLRLIRVMP